MQTRCHGHSVTKLVRLHSRSGSASRVAEQEGFMQTRCHSQSVISEKGFMQTRCHSQSVTKLVKAPQL